MQFYEDFYMYAFVLWRYATVQIWHKNELFVPGIVASTLDITFQDMMLQYVIMQWCAHLLLHFALSL